MPFALSSDHELIALRDGGLAARLNVSKEASALSVYLVSDITFILKVIAGHLNRLKHQCSSDR